MAAHKVIRKYKGVFQTCLESKQKEIVSKLYEKQIITEEERKATIGKIITILKEKVQKDGDTFHDILEVFGSVPVPSVNVSIVSEEFERELRSTRRGSLDSQRDAASKQTQALSKRASKKLAGSVGNIASSVTSPDSKIKPLKAGHQQVPQGSRSSSFSSKEKSQLAIPLLDPIPGSPSTGSKKKYSQPTTKTEKDSVTSINKEEQKQQREAPPTLECSTVFTDEPATEMKQPLPFSSNYQSKYETQEREYINELDKEIVKTLESEAEPVHLTTSYKNIRERLERQYQERLKQELQDLNEYSELKQKDLQQNHYAACEAAANLSEKLEEKKEEVKKLTAELEKAKEEMEEMKTELRIVGIIARKSGIQGKQQILKMIDELMEQVESPGSQQHAVKILENIQSHLQELRKRPATTGGLRKGW